jgi:hypothetical protein
LDLLEVKIKLQGWAIRLYMLTVIDKKSLSEDKNHLGLARMSQQAAPDELQEWPAIFADCRGR